MFKTILRLGEKRCKSLRGVRSGLVEERTLLGPYLHQKGGLNPYKLRV